MLVFGLLLAAATGYLTGAALFAGSRGSFLEPSSSKTADPGWTVLTPSVRTSAPDESRLTGP
jgi:hypothetical protein